MIPFSWMMYNVGAIILLTTYYDLFSMSLKNISLSSSNETFILNGQCADLYHLKFILYLNPIVVYLLFIYQIKCPSRSMERNFSPPTDRSDSWKSTLLITLITGIFSWFYNWYINETTPCKRIAIIKFQKFV